MSDINLRIFLQTTAFLDFNENWDLVKYTSSIIDTSDGRKIIIHILDIWDNVNEEAKQIWIDLIERAGFYPYYVSKINSDSDKYEISPQASIRTAFFKSDYLPDVYFHEKQKEIEQSLSEGKNIAVSAPTSFGKSLLIEEVVARKQFDNILIIQPTLALIDETRRKLKKYADYYNIVVNTRQQSQDKNVFILTAERVLEFPELPRIDFFVIDEFYKISNRRNDSRIDALNVTLLKVMEQKPQAMFLTPTVDSLSKNFIEKYNVEFFQTDYALVNTQLVEIRNNNSKVLSGNSKKNRLFDLLFEQSESSIVYVKSPNEAYKLANEYLEYLGTKICIINPDLEIFEWMDENIAADWHLKNLLKHGIGAHNGALPRHVVTSEIDLFNDGVLKVLFATASLIEGVNTIAKNMMIYSQNKGGSRIDFFDFANIRGRAGRMNQHFTGMVYLFIEEPESEHFVIDVPIVDQDEVSDEILVNIPDIDVKDKDRKAELNSGIEDSLKEIIRDNLISVKGQKQLYLYILENYSKLSYLRWRNMPTYNQLWQTLYLGYKYLKSTDSPSFAKGKATTALKIVNEPLKKVILDQKNYYVKQNTRNPENKAIDFVLRFQRNEASFEIPKLLAVVESIQKFVFENVSITEYGDYSMFSSLLENDQIDEQLQFLVDYGVPSSAIKKIHRDISGDIEGDFAIMQYIRDNRSKIYPKLLPYEQKLLENAVIK